MKGKEKWDANKFEYIENWQSFDPCDVKQVDEEALAYLCKCANEIEAQHDDRRERIATAAMQGMLSNPNIVNDKFKENLIASWAVDCADALIAELDKREAKA